MQESTSTAKRCRNHVKVAIILKLALQLATPVQMVITATKTVNSKLVLAALFANGQMLPFLLSPDNVVQAIIVMLIMNLRVLRGLIRAPVRVYARQSSLDKCGSQQTINLSRVHGDTTNHSMQLKQHARYVQLVIHVAIRQSNQLNVHQALFLQLMGWGLVSHALLDFTVILQMICQKTVLLVTTLLQVGLSVLYVQLGKVALTNKAPLIALLAITVLLDKITANLVHQDLNVQSQLTFLLPVLVVSEMLVILKLVKQVTIAVGVKLLVPNVLKALTAVTLREVHLLFVHKVNGQMQVPYLAILAQPVPPAPILLQLICFQ